MTNRWWPLIGVCLLAVLPAVSMTAQTAARQEQATAPPASPPAEGPSNDPAVQASAGPRRIQSDSPSSLGVHLYVQGQAFIGIEPTNDPSTESRQLQVHNPNAAGSAANFTDTTTGNGLNDGLYVGYSGGAYLWNNENTFLSFATNNERRLTIKEDGKVGIGTIEPLDKLHVRGAGYQRIRIESTDSTTQVVQYPIAGGAYWDNGSLGQNTYVRVSNAAVLDTTAMTILPGGNVGLGVTPTVKLEVNGDIKANGVIHAKFQDVAEWVPAHEDLAAGTVVVVSPRNHVAASAEPYDTRVAGVVSAQPGLILGEGGPSRVLVATTGRVKVRVDASNGPISEGDLLVSSASSGTAMKSVPLLLSGRKFHQPGTVIGKALEPLDKGSGEILVLLSLQ